MHLLYYEAELLDLKLLALNLAIFVLDLASCNIEIWLQFLKFGHADNIFADFNDLELKFLIFNRPSTQLVAQRFNFKLIFLYLWFLRLSLGLQFGLILLKGIYLD